DLEDLIIRHKGHPGTGLCFHFTYYFYLAGGDSSFISLLEYFTIPVNFHFKPFTQSIHNRYTHTVQTSGYLVCISIKFSPCVKLCHYQLKRGYFFRRVHSRRDTASVIFHCDRAVFIHLQLDIVTMPCQCLIDGIVDHLVNQVMKTTRRYIPYVHRGTFPYVLHPFQDLNITLFILITACRFIFCHVFYLNTISFITFFFKTLFRFSIISSFLRESSYLHTAFSAFTKSFVCLIPSGVEWFAMDSPTHSFHASNIFSSCIFPSTPIYFKNSSISSLRLTVLFILVFRSIFLCIIRHFLLQL